MKAEPHQYSLARNKEFCNFCPGYCCYRLEGASLCIMAVDINRIARHFNITDGEVRKRFLDGKYTFKTREDGSCVFLHGDRMCKRCSIHQARPKQCRDFPYDKPCPYLESEQFLEIIQKRIEEQGVTGCIPILSQRLKTLSYTLFFGGDAHPPLWNLLFCGRVGISFDSAEKNITDFAWERLGN